MSAIHICGFFADDQPRIDGMNVTACPDGESPHSAFERIASNIEFFGGAIESVSRTWPLGGRRIEASTIEFTAPAHDKAARMWHVITEAHRDEWKAKP